MFLMTEEMLNQTLWNVNAKEILYRTALRSRETFIFFDKLISREKVGLPEYGEHVKDEMKTAEV